MVLDDYDLRELISFFCVKIENCVLFSDLSLLFPLHCFFFIILKMNKSCSKVLTLGVSECFFVDDLMEALNQSRQIKNGSGFGMSSLKA